MLGPYLYFANVTKIFFFIPIKSWKTDMSTQPCIKIFNFKGVKMPLKLNSKFLLF